MNIASYVKTMLNDPERKSLYEIIKESLHCTLIEKELPYYYFTSLLYKKNADKYVNYIGHKKVYNIINNFFYAKTNGRNYNLEDKLLFNEIIVGADIPTTKLFAYNDKYTLSLENESVELRSEGDLYSYLSDFINKSESDSLFIKPVDGVGGKNTFKLDKKSLLQTDVVSKIYASMSEIKYLFQETVKQHQILNAIYSSSINTIRAHSYFNRETNEIIVVSALMRFGSGGGVVDNGSSGGLFVPIDIKEWSLVGKGMSYLNKGGRTYKTHPDTNVLFDGALIPFGDEIDALIKKAAPLFVSDFIGWDIAITPDGPIIIEGNDCPHLIMAQMACGGFKSHPVYSDIFKKYIS